MKPRIEVRLRLPAWLTKLLDQGLPVLRSVEDRMRFVIRLAAENTRRKTGGPFGAAVFEEDTGRLVACGVNVVKSARCSAAHAEMVALSLAQQALGTHDLAAAGEGKWELVSSVEPCSMCLGAIPWSGIRRLVCGARGEDACAVGFDEGAKPVAWTKELRRRGIAVVRDVCREEATAVLGRYAAAGGLIYNGRRG